MAKDPVGKIPAVATLRNNFRAQAGEPGGKGEPPNGAKTHDYTGRNRHFGHDYTFNPRPGTNGKYADMSGWGRGIKNGDFLLLENGKESTRYRVNTIEYYRDPADMWQAMVVFDPRP